MIAAERHDLDEATSHLEQALSSFQRSGDELGAAAALASLGITAEYRGDLESACELMEDCLAISRECGDSRRTASSIDNLGFFWQQRGDLERGPEAFTKRALRYPGRSETSLWLRPLLRTSARPLVNKEHSPMLGRLLKRVSLSLARQPIAAGTSLTCSKS